MKKIISVIFITIILNSCGSVSNFFGGEDIDKDRIQGETVFTEHRRGRRRKGNREQRKRV